MDDHLAVEDDEFLSLVDAVEADVLKKRKMNDGGRSYTPPSNSNHNPNSSEEEGQYLAALRGSNSHLWQTMNIPKTNTNKRPAETASYGGAGGGGGGAAGGVCFKCQQPGHWAKDCVASTYVGPDRGDESGPQAPEKQCPCGGGPCLVLISSTEKNPGRKFYRCPVREDGGRCKFFEWCDAAQGSSGAYGGQSQTRVFSTDISKGPEPSMQCPCGAGLCLVLTSKTDKNLGRQFLRCPLKQEEGPCKFFKWCDELNSTSNPSPSMARGFSSNNGSTPSNSGRTGPSLCCYKCGMDGHWAKDCTNSSSGLTGVYGTAQGERSSASNTCFKCGQAGHWAKDCSSQVSNSSYGSREFSNSSFSHRGASRPASSTYRSR